MKRIVWLLAVLLICQGVTAADDFLADDTAYWKHMRRALGLDTSNVGALSDKNAKAFLTEAIIYTLPMIKAQKKVTSFVTTYKQNTYAMDSTLVGVIDVWWSKNDSLKALRPLPITQWTEQEHKKTSGQEDGYLKRPSFYQVSDSQIFVGPTPSESRADTIKILGWHKIVNVLATSNLTSIPQEYRAVILNYAIWRAASARQNPVAAMYFQVWQMSVQVLTGAVSEETP